MSRSKLELGLAVAAALLIAAAVAASPVRADPEPVQVEQPRPRRAKKREEAPQPRDTRDAIAQQFGDEAAAIERALTSVTEKLGAADTARTRRLAAAYRVLQMPTGEGDDAMAAARRRAAARLLLDRDLAERKLLAEEVVALRGAAARTAADAKKVPDIVLPESIARPVRGTIARRFGTFVHERSKATLSRRGIDFEVSTRAEVVSPAGGQIRYAGPIRGLDHGIVVDHGTFYSVIAKLASTAVPVGTRVERGDRVGRAQRGRVYLEVRVKVGPGGLPIDPEPLFERAADRGAPR